MPSPPPGRHPRRPARSPSSSPPSPHLRAPRAGSALLPPAVPTGQGWLPADSPPPPDATHRILAIPTASRRLYHAIRDAFDLLLGPPRLLAGYYTNHLLDRMADKVNADVLKKAVVAGSKDCFDDLPELLHSRDAVRTSVLGRRWRTLWKSVSALRFDPSQFGSAQRDAMQIAQVSKLIIRWSKWEEFKIIDYL